MVIFFFLLIFGLTFYSRFQTASFEREATRQLKMRSVQTAIKASSMPELQYGIEDGTLDLVKVRVFNGALLSDEDFRLYYFDVFGYSEIYIEQLYPTKINYSIYKNLPPNTDFYQLVESPISLYEPTTGKYYFGILGIRLYQR